MKFLIQKTVLLLALSCFLTPSFSQIGLGLVYSGDYYQHYVNPEVAGDETGRSSGNAVTNIALGPKIWLGGGNFSLSVEAQANLGITAFDVQEYKGMGAVAFPILAKLNFMGLSGFNGDGSFGFSIGGGIQYARTELFGVTDEFDNLTDRSLFRTYVGEIAVGGGFKGIIGSLFVRYGIGEDNARMLNVGTTIELNFLGD